MTKDGVCYYGFDESDFDYVDAEKQNPDLPRKGFVVWSPDSKKLASFFGIHPAYRESGDGKSAVRMSKKGRK